MPEKIANYARGADSGGVSFPSMIWDSLKPFPGRGRITLRLAVACALIMFLFRVLPLGVVGWILGFIVAASQNYQIVSKNSKPLCLGMLPTLVNRLEAIAVRIENVRGIVARIVIQARPRLAVISRASPHRCVVEPIHLVLALGDKADMCSPGVRIALS